MLGILLSAENVVGAERYNRWDKESIIRVSMDYVSRVKREFSQRASMVEQQTGSKAPLDYRYFHGDLTIDEERKQERFLEGRLSDRDSNQHIENLLSDLETVRHRLAEREMEACALWEQENSQRKRGRVDASEIQADVFGTPVAATSLGVILDNSPSMAPYLEALRDEISRNFSESYYVEVWGSFLSHNQGKAPWFYAAPSDEDNPFDPKWYAPEIPQSGAHLQFTQWKRDNVSAILALVELMKVDSIYWFCDFDDSVDDYAVRRIAKPILDNGVRLYVHTLKSNPPDLLRLLVEKSGGELSRKRIR